MKAKHVVKIFVAILALIGVIGSACIGAKWGKDNFNITVKYEGENVKFDADDFREVISENENLKSRMSSYETEIADLKSQNEELSEKISGLESDISESLVKPVENEENNTTIDVTSTSIEPSLESGEIEFSEVSEILYDGVNFRKYDESDNAKFLVGGNEYCSGFELNTNSMKDGFVYFNLANKYSIIKFDVGRNTGDKCDARLLITSKSGIEEEYDLAGDIPSQHIEVNVNGASDLTVKLKYDDKFVGFGFFNVYLVS